MAESPRACISGRRNGGRLRVIEPILLSLSLSLHIYMYTAYTYARRESTCARAGWISADPAPDDDAASIYSASGRI